MPRFIFPLTAFYLITISCSYEETTIGSFYESVIPIEWDDASIEAGIKLISKDVSFKDVLLSDAGTTTLGGLYVAFAMAIPEHFGLKNSDLEGKSIVEIERAITSNQERHLKMVCLVRSQTEVFEIYDIAERILDNAVIFGLHRSRQDAKMEYEQALEKIGEYLLSEATGNMPSLSPVESIDSTEVARRKAVAEEAFVLWALQGADRLLRYSSLGAVQAVNSCEAYAKDKTAQTYKATTEAAQNYYKFVGEHKKEASVEIARYEQEVRSDHFSEEAAEACYRTFLAYKAISDYISSADKAVKACEDRTNTSEIYKATAEAGENAKSAVYAIEDAYKAMIAKRKKEMLAQ